MEYNEWAAAGGATNCSSIYELFSQPNPTFVVGFHVTWGEVNCLRVEDDPFVYYFSLSVFFSYKVSIHIMGCDDDSLWIADCDLIFVVF